MISHVIEFARSVRANQVTVGTGNSSLGPLAFYQKRGFRITGLIPNFFENYDPPIVEQGIHCLDLIKLSLEIALSPRPDQRNAQPK